MYIVHGKPGIQEIFGQYFSVPRIWGSGSREVLGTTESFYSPISWDAQKSGKMKALANNVDL